MDVVLTYKRDVESKDDLQLALLEATSLAGHPPREVTHQEALNALNTDVLPYIAADQRTFLVKASSEIIARLLRRLAFWDLILVSVHTRIKPVDVSVGNAWTSAHGVFAFATQTQIFEWTAYAKDAPALIAAIKSGQALDVLIEICRPAIDAPMRSTLSPAARRKNEYLTHGFHKYKAKFFPRMARALINYTMPGELGVVLDPYCGSGTTGVEASLMGLQALEFDLDPLSAFIANSKALLGHLDLAKFEAAVSRLPVKALRNAQPSLLGSEPYKLPQFLLKRRPGRLTEEVVKEIEFDVTLIRELISTYDDYETKALLELSLSHAIATKVSLRWMGTGDNRYAIEIGKRSLYDVFRGQLKYMVAKLATWDAVRGGGFVREYGHVNVGVCDCTCLPLEDCSIDSVVTSPPYLPAASGRETYLRSRAASIMALKLMTEAAIHACETQIVGSILAVPEELGPLPESVTDLVKWMLPQRERTSKALPTAAYFEKLGDSLKEMKRVLKPSGIIALVVSKEHMFYEMTTRKVLRTFDMVAAISEIAVDARFGICLELDRVVEIELPKMDFAARPGSHGQYSEAIIFLRKAPGRFKV